MAFKETPYVPLIKHGGFNPNPVAGNIPIFADSITNPKVIGTPNYEEFWDEQIDRCINGYDTAGVHIPGRYYFFLNFPILKGLYGPQYPFYVDLDREWHDTFDQVKRYHKTGIISVKARRKGLSELAQTVMAHGMRFIDGYRAAVTAGLETYTNGLKRKFENTENTIIKDFRLNVLQNNDKIYKAGYEIKDAVGGYIDGGYGGIINFETMYDDATKLEGEYFNDVICEESGRYKLLSETVSSIEPALMFGSQMIGTFLIYGTGGNILSTSKAFKDYWDNAETYGLVRLWVPGTRKHFPFFGNTQTETFPDPDTGEEIDAIPNLRHLTPEQRLGVEDTEAAREYILRKRIEYSKLPNKKKLKELNQALPLTVEEAFTSGGSNNFNDEKIYDRLFTIEGDPHNFRPIILEWVNSPTDLESDGTKRLQVKPRLATKNDPDWKIIWVYQNPLNDMKDLDIGGIDGYNQDESKVSKSLGAMTVVRQGNRVNMVDKGIHKGQYPVCLYYQRPPRKEDFFDICLKISVWYNLSGNTMCNAEQDFVIDYYVKNGGIRYLSKRPKTFDAPKTKQVHKFGAKMTGYSKDVILGKVQSWVEDFVQLCNFPAMLRDMLAYDEAYIGTDWDSVDALAYAIMRIEDMRTRPRKNDEDIETDEVEWMKDRDGNIVIVPGSGEDKREKKEKKEKKSLPSGEYSGQWTSLEYREKKNYD